MRNMLRKRAYHASALLGTASAIVLAASAPAFAQASSGTTSGETATQSQEIVVTGTRIAGVAPVGSATITLSTKDIKSSGLTSTADIVQQQPQLLSLGAGASSYAAGAEPQGTTLNVTEARAINIRGIGREATLSLLNSHRVPYTSADMTFFDPDALPAQMLQRVEVVADGTSPIYGADAVAGTVNYILRDPFDGGETYGQYGAADSVSQWQATQILGKTWSGGGIVVSYQHSHFDPLAAKDRPDLYSDDYSPYGGHASPISASPGNVIVGADTYAIPKGQDGTALTLAQLGPVNSANTQNSWYAADATAETSRDGFVMNFKQSLTDWVDLFADGYYSRRDFSISYPPPTGTYLVPNTNAFSPCHDTTGAPAELVTACGTGSLSVAYSFANDIPNVREGYQLTYSAAAGARFHLPYKWEFTLEAEHGGDSDYYDAISQRGVRTGGVFSTELASATPATSYNLFCDGTAFTCNAPSVTTGIGSRFLTFTRYLMWDYSANADGPLFSLPGGDVRLAVGGEYNWQRVRADNSNGIGNTSPREIASAYAEFYIPLVGDNNAMPGIRKLELDIAERNDNYTDRYVHLGATQNPKIGINWTPFEGFKVHGSFGTSFRAPTMLQTDVTAQHGYLSNANSGITVACTGCNTPGNVILTDIGYGADRPSTARSWSAGFDWTPPEISGLDVSVNWYKLSYNGDIDTAIADVGYVGSINAQTLNSFIIYNPSMFPTLAANNPVSFVPANGTNAATCSGVIGQKINTQALFDAYVTCLGAGGDAGILGAPAAPSKVIAIEDSRHLNTTNLSTDGIDFSANKTWDNSWGSWHVGAIAEYILDFDVSLVPGTPQLPEVGKLGFPIQFKIRTQAGWDGMVGPGRLSATAFVNYADSYNVPPAQLPAGVGTKYQTVDSYTTMDLTLIYALDNMPSMVPGKSLTFTLGIQNLFDSAPPLVLNSQPPGIKFDQSNANPLGRLIQFQAGFKF